jgi:hypothetical protein
MNVREWLMTRLKDTPGYDKVGGRFYPRGSLGIGGNPADPEVPYAMYSLRGPDANTSVRETQASGTYYLYLYVYDQKGSYVRIEEIHRLLRETLEVLSGHKDESWRCTDILFLGLGDETTDGSNNLIIGTYRLTGPQ